jgi:hypothetical protein
VGRHARKTEKKTRRKEGTKIQDRKVRRKARIAALEARAKAEAEKKPEAEKK